MNKSLTILLLFVCMIAIFADISEAVRHRTDYRYRYKSIAKRQCAPFDGYCYGDNGSQANCCNGLYCQKNDPSWANGRCYYNPGRK